MAETYPLLFRGEDRPEFKALLERCRDLQVADSMAAAVRLAVRLANSASDEDLKRGEL